MSWFLYSLVSFLATTVVIHGPVYHPAAGGGGPPISDDFNRSDSDSLGSNWTEIQQDADIVSNKLQFTATFTADMKEAVFTGTGTSTVNQVAVATFNQDTDAAAGFIFRYTNDATERYWLRFDVGNDKLQWYHLAGDESATFIAQSATYTMSFPITIGIAVNGTGNSTEIYFWDSPSGDASNSGSWGTPDITMTDNPNTNAVDTGTYTGVAGWANAATFTVDDFSADDY